MSFSDILLVFRLTAGFDRDMRIGGWSLVSDSEAKDGEFTPELVEFLKDSEDGIDGEKMLKRAAESGACVGQRHAEAMSRNQDKIPKGWRKCVLIFPDTIWQGLDGSRYVAYLHWRDWWYLHFYYLGRVFNRVCRLVRLCKV